MCRPLLLHTVPQRNRNDPFYRVGKCWYIQRDLKTGNKKINNSHAAAWVLRLVTSCFKYRRMIVIISMCRKHLGNKKAGRKMCGPPATSQLHGMTAWKMTV